MIQTLIKSERSLICLLGLSSMLACTGDVEIQHYRYNRDNKPVPTLVVPTLTPISDITDESLVLDLVIKNELVSQSSIYEMYGENIFYSNLSDIDFSAVPKEKIELPSSFNRDIWEPKIKDSDKLRRLFFETAKELGFSKERIEDLSPQEAILLSINFVAERLSFYYVDSDKKFIANHGENLPIEEYLEIGQGDCDKYMHAVIVAFEIIKGLNPNLANVYVKNNFYGNITQPHAWNTVLCVTLDEITVSHIDPTFSEIRGRLEGKIGWHVIEDRNLFLASIYSMFWEWEPAFKMYENLFRDNDYADQRSDIFKRMAYLAYQMQDLKKLEFVNGQALEYGALEQYAEILYYLCILEKAEGSLEKSKQYERELRQQYPSTNFWVKELATEYEKI